MQQPPFGTSMVSTMTPTVVLVLMSALTANAMSGLRSKSASKMAAELPFTDENHPASRYMHDTAPATCDACRVEYMPGMGIASERCDCMAFQMSKRSNETLVDKGLTYNGAQTKTRSGKTCLNWNHEAFESSWVPPDASTRTYNECRNHDSSAFGVRDTIWCYTSTSPTVKWEYCDPARGSFRPIQYSFTCSTAAAATSWVSTHNGCKCQYGVTAAETTCLDIPVQGTAMDPQDPRLNYPPLLIVTKAQTVLSLDYDLFDADDAVKAMLINDVKESFLNATQPLGYTNDQIAVTLSKDNGPVKATVQISTRRGQDGSKLKAEVDRMTGALSNSIQERVKLLPGVNTFLENGKTENDLNISAFPASAQAAASCDGYTCPDNYYNRPMGSIIGCAESSGCTDADQDTCCTQLDALPQLLEATKMKGFLTSSSWAGICAHGTLRTLAQRTADNQCGSCDAGYRLDGTACHLVE